MRRGSRDRVQEKRVQGDGFNGKGLGVRDTAILNNSIQVRESDYEGHEC